MEHRRSSAPCYWSEFNPLMPSAGPSPPSPPPSPPPPPPHPPHPHPPAAILLLRDILAIRDAIEVSLRSASTQETFRMILSSRCPRQLINHVPVHARTFQASSVRKR